MLGPWFERSDQIVDIASIDVGQIADRTRLSYRFIVNNPDGHFQVEQHAYFDVTGGLISWMRVLCSGFQPVSSTPA